MRLPAAATRDQAPLVQALLPVRGSRALDRRRIRHGHADLIRAHLAPEDPAARPLALGISLGRIMGGTRDFLHVVPLAAAMIVLETRELELRRLEHAVLLRP